MKNTRFYLEFPTRSAKKRSGKRHIGHAGNVFAVFPAVGGNRFGYADYNGRWMVEGCGAILPEPNSCVASTAANVREWLHPMCKRIPEALARTIHPALFDRLDSE